MTVPEQQLEQAHLLLIRGNEEQAVSLLRTLCSQYPNWSEPRQLLHKFKQEKAIEQADEKQQQETRRTWRYYLRLQTGWSRLCWGIGALASLAYGVYGEVVAVPLGAARGFSTEITTMVETGGRYTRHLESWTRPIYYDALYSSVFILLAVVMAVVLIWVSKGAAQWEELDASEYDGSRYGPSF